jgi:hypothetical protein
MVAVVGLREKYFPSCVTDTVRFIAPELSVTVAVRPSLLVFSGAVSLSVPLFVPEAGLIVSQESDETAVHAILAKIAVVSVTASSESVILLRPEYKKRPSCETGIESTRVVPIVIYTKALSDDVEAFATADTVMSVLPASPLSGVMVSHEAEEEAVHATSLLILIR